MIFANIGQLIFCNGMVPWETNILLVWLLFKNYIIFGKMSSKIAFRTTGLWSMSRILNFFWLLLVRKCCFRHFPERSISGSQGLLIPVSRFLAMIVWMVIAVTLCFAIFLRRHHIFFKSIRERWKGSQFRKGSILDNYISIATLKY